MQREERDLQQKKEARRRKMQRFAFWAFIVALVAGSLYGLLRLSNTSSLPSDGSLTQNVTQTDHVKGNTSSPVVLIEYGDFQCPACKHYYPMIKQLGVEFGDRIQIVSRHFPLKMVHPNAEEAAWAAEAAAAQGKFWEMHDLLFERQDDWARERDPRDMFVEYASILVLDKDQFVRDYESDAARQRVEEQYQSGIAAGVKGTPTFFLNGKPIANPKNYEELQQLVASALGAQ